ncbi:MAG: hypothetical protein JO026_00035 [Patescibacteria group bacterium]|nr:hypothetical protein [Patescibacteria group bacterium]
MAFDIGREGGISRRTFGASVGAIFLSALLPQVAEARTFLSSRAEHFKETRSSGIIFLHDKALKDEGDRTSFFIQNGTSARWVHKGIKDESFPNLPPSWVKPYLADSHTHVQIFHTHPLALVAEAREAASGSQLTYEEAMQPMPMPPTSAEVLSLIDYKTLLGQGADRVSAAVVDSVGTWEYDVSLSHPFVQKFAHICRMAKHVFDGLPAEVKKQHFEGKPGNVSLAGKLMRFRQGDTVLPDEEHISLTGARSPDLSDAIRILALFQPGKVDPHWQRMAEDTLQAANTFAESEPFARFSEAADWLFPFQDVSDPRALSSAVAAYEKAGVSLFFTPFNAKTALL